MCYCGCRNENSVGQCRKKAKDICPIEHEELTVKEIRDLEEYRIDMMTEVAIESQNDDKEHY